MPPMDADSRRVRSSAASSVCSVYDCEVGKSLREVVPNKTMLKTQESGIDRTNTSSARAAAAMRPPDIDPEQSTTKTSSVASGVGSKSGIMVMQAAADPSGDTSSSTRGSCGDAVVRSMTRSSCIRSFS